MANPTSNFGWQMPTPTDLVTDLPADFEVFGQAVDTTLVDLKGGTSGQVLAKASNTDMDFSWVAIDPLLILDAKGDLITATAADTPARLAVGSNDQVLTVDSSTSTGLKWAAVAGGGETLISTTTFSGSAVDLTSIPQTFNHLRLEISALQSSSTGCRLFVRINSDTGANYNWSMAGLNDGTASNVRTEADSRFDYIGFAGDTGESDDDKGYVVIEFWNYTNTATRKFVTSTWYSRNATVLKQGKFTGLYFGSNDAITTINLTGACGAATLNTGTARLYGVK